LQQYYGIKASDTTVLAATSSSQTTVETPPANLSPELGPQTTITSARPLVGAQGGAPYQSQNLFPLSERSIHNEGNMGSKDQFPAPEGAGSGNLVGMEKPFDQEYPNLEGFDFAEWNTMNPFDGPLPPWWSREG